MTQQEYEALIERWKNDFSDRNYETLMTETLGLISDIYDKRDGSMIYNAVAALMFEVAMLYTGALPFTINETFIDTASRDGLIRRAKDISMEPWAATKAIHYAVFSGVEVPKGTRFSCEDLNYFVIPYPDTGELTKDVDFGEDGVFRAQLVQCETAGTISNNYTGTMVPIEYVEGLQKAELRHCLTPAEDEEDTEHFRARLIEARRSIAFGGNIADYRTKVLALEGVGQCKVYPEWNSDVRPAELQLDDTEYEALEEGLFDLVNAYTTITPAQYDKAMSLIAAAHEGKLTVGGAVRIVVAGVDAQHITIDEALRAKLQKEIDPVAGEGYGIAPIGHVVSIVSATATPITVTLQLQFKTSNHEVRAAVEEVIDQYFAALYTRWSNEDGLVIAPSILSARLLDDDRLAALIKSVDVVQFGSAAAWANVTLGWDELPTRFDVTITETDA
ncbi:MAG: baseplate J/gp47 family protein [Clostridia bacterium]|nr:baseplate J/gp47 family protein [Clostridia bacterium]